MDKTPADADGAATIRPRVAGNTQPSTTNHQHPARDIPGGKLSGQPDYGHLHRPVLRTGARELRRHRRLPRNPHPPARPPAPPQARHHRILPDPPRRRQRIGVHRLPRAAPSHHGAHQGRHALRQQPPPRRSGRARHRHELEMRAGRPALRRCQRRHRGRSVLAQPPRARSRQPPLHAGDDPLRRPRKPT